MLFDTSGESIRTEVVRTLILKLPSNKVLELKNCYYVPRIVWNIISIPILLEQDFEINGKSNDCSFCLSNEFYGHAFIDNDFFFLSLNNNILHVDQIKKRKRENVNVTYL